MLQPAVMNRTRRLALCKADIADVVIGSILVNGCHGVAEKLFKLLVSGDL